MKGYKKGIFPPPPQKGMLMSKMTLFNFEEAPQKKMEFPFRSSSPSLGNNEGNEMKICYFKFIFVIFIIFFSVSLNGDRSNLLSSMKVDKYTLLILDQRSQYLKYPKAKDVVEATLPAGGRSGSMIDP